MNVYHCMIELKDPENALSFASAAEDWFNYLTSKHLIGSYRLLRRKFGLASSDHTDFIVEMEVEDMAKLESTFSKLSTIEDHEEKMYRKMHDMIATSKIGFYRIYPDPIKRERIALV